VTGPAPREDVRSAAADEAAHSQAASAEVAAAIAQGIGGRQGLLDSGLPTGVFLLAYLVSGSQLYPSLWAAMAAAVVVAVVRLVRGQSLRHVITGFVGLGIAAVFAARTGRAEDFFLPGILVNIAYGSVFAISALLRRPLVGYASGALTGDLQSWRRDSKVYRGALAATWVWAGMFGVRVLVQLPLYLAGAVAALGVAKLAMGWPLFLLAGFVSYRIMQPRMQRLRLGQSSSAT
jgi:hypothetical protein